jgi:hypothetical protein
MASEQVRGHLAIAFAKANGQLIAYVLSTGEFIDITASHAGLGAFCGLKEGHVLLVIHCGDNG